MKNSKLKNLLYKLFFLFTLLFSSPLIVTSQNENVIKWIDENSIKVKTVKAESGFNDLMPLKNILKDKRIVALGEATHGTKEIFQMKHRMLEFLVKEMGFLYFAIEANLTEAYAVNDYVMYGKGDPQKALDGLYFWTWNTKEVMAMIQWMRNYNKDKEDKDKVRFYGFDMQVPTVAISEFYKYLHEVDSTYANNINPDVIKIQSLQYPEQKEAKEYFNKIENILSHINEKKESYIATSSPREYNIERQNLVVVSQFFKMMSAPNDTVISELRDSCMSENVKWLLNLEGNSSKFVLWAHNGHIAENDLGADNGIMMGDYLKKYFKDNYYALGFDFYTGSFQAIEEGKGLVEFNYTLQQNSTGFTFSKSKNKIFIFDFADAEKNQDMKKFIYDSIPSICIGALFSVKDAEKYYIKNPLATIYDGIIFIRETHRAIPNYDINKNKNAIADFGNLMFKIDAKQYAEKQFKFSAYIKIGEKTTNGQGQLWARVDKTDNSVGFFDNMDNRPIKSKDWKYCEITGTIDKDAAAICFGCMFIGKGELYVDDIEFSYLENGQWIPIALPDSTFEKYLINTKPDDWKIYDENYKILVTNKTSHQGEKCIEFER